MSLPPGFLDELRGRTSMAQVAGRKVLWDMRKSNQGRGDMWAPCPFHQEKTASFHVDDRKGYYYCFGCHAKGDAISFVRETENVGFMEAVEILAAEAGMPMPERDPRAQQKADRRAVLSEVMEQAVQFYRLQLRTSAAAEARAYLERRGLDAGALERFEIGFAPPGWQTLGDHLRGKGVPDDQLIAAGLAKASDKGRAPYDVFRDRILFPIRDVRGRAIAFGGRAMDPGDKAKYLNSPETELFDKGRTLYNIAAAREAAGKGRPLILAEGYMDVIALSEAGFGAAVAPLGTAVTETQLQLLWRMADEPVVALDGDKAGLRAAYRVVDLALPLLEAGKSLRFALMPEGKDPDDLIRAEGAAGMQRVLDAALPMAKLLWRQETEGKVFDSPERKAALDKAIRQRVGVIKDPSLRHHYGEELKELRWHLFRSARPAGKGRGSRRADEMAPVAGTKASALVAEGEIAERRLRETVILAAMFAAPEILPEFESQLEAMDCADGTLARLRDTLLRHVGAPSDAVRDAVRETLGRETLETLLSARHVAVIPCLRKPGEVELARLTVAEELAKLSAWQGWQTELAEAEADLQGVADEALTWRLAQAAQARNSAGRRQDEAETDYEIGPNGAHMDREERSALDTLLGQIKFDKTRRR
ncbi:DNA primase [Thalassococcus sp. CAU 1522]|uniref:DNA primase n=1 Tax=Thalassococcus arenae TaxID=2851652 RepID=A0ABS6N8J2_9RHOB|nr:DNA primase [Thalassococcus arenae]MBV2360321.1 DNA primase [Thalassococcus arenae]